MNRTYVIQKIIDTLNSKCYLEIGVQYGANLFRINVQCKIAVDPNFSFLNFRTLGLFLKYNKRAHITYHRCTSDEYFDHIEPGSTFDLVFVDGLHTYDQSLRDVNNALNYLSEGGLVLLHDCNPGTEAEACPAQSCQQAAEYKLPGWTGVWCGDVWKTICNLRAFRDDLNVFVLDCDLGVGVITRGKPEHY